MRKPDEHEHRREIYYVLAPAAVYGLTLAAVAVAWGARWLFDPFLGNHLPFVTFFVSVAVAAWLGGWKTAIFATVLGLVLAMYFFVPPRFSLQLPTGPDLFGLAMYFMVCFAFAGFGEAMLTAQRRAEVRRELLRTTLASVGDAVITTDTDTRITYINSVAESLTGWTQTEAVGRPLDTVFRIINEVSRKPVENPAIRALREGVIVGLANHTVLVRKDGSERPIDDSAAPIKDAHGQVAGCVLIFRDVTESRRADRAVRDSEARLAAMFHSALDCIISIDHEGKIIEFNAAAERTFGYGRESALGREMAELIIPPSLRKRHRQGLVRYLATGEGPVLNQRIELTALRLDGSEFPIELSITRIPGDGPPVFTGYVRDITDRKQMQVSERRLASIVESSDDAIISKTLDGIVRTWNASAERLFGYTAEQAVGRHISFLIPADRPDEEDRIIKRIRAGERVEHFDTVRMRSDGRPISVSLTISPIKDETGRVIGASKIARDITERKDNEQKIYGLMAELKEADRRKDEFLAMLAHELRGPLAPLSNMLEILRKSDASGNLQDQARETMARQLGQLVRLVDDLLDVSRITRDKLEFRKGRVELASAVHQSVEVCRPLAQNADHEIRVTLPPQPIYLDADPVRLAQVFSNLLSNACKYTERGGRIWFTAERQGSDVVVSIKDTGTGIPADKLQSIFELFTQVDSSLERSQSGLGIGLTLVKRLVEMHSGSIEAKSEGKGSGSEFIVRLPILIDAPKSLTPEPAAAKSPPPSRRILVVDDNQDSAVSLAMLLEITGNETQTAHDGLEALAAAEKFLPEVVLLDIGLPKLNGHEVCRRIREQPWGKDMMLVALTGWGQDEDRRKSQEAGFNHHMVKPVDHAALMKLLAGSAATV